MERDVPWESENISAQDYAEASERYRALAAAVRGLLHASVATRADADTTRAAIAAIESVTGSLLGHIPARRGVVLRHTESGLPVTWSNPVTGLRNPLAPPVEVRRDADGRWRSRFVLGDVYQGPPGLVHGGICALILDQLLGEAATDGMSKLRFTGTITVKFLRGTPLGPLRAEALADPALGPDGDRKTYVRGFIGDSDGPTVEAQGVFVTPAWAREVS